MRGSPPARPKLSVSTVYPVELPKLKFYTERAIHEEPRDPLRQAPVTFIRYTRNKHRRRYGSSTEPALPLASVHESMLITNCLERECGEQGEREEREEDR